MLALRSVGLAAIISITALAHSASAENLGYSITCLNRDDYCTVRQIQSARSSMRWYDGVYVRGDGDIGRHTVEDQRECAALCRRNSDCVMVEFYFGREVRSPACNLFSSMQKLRWNPAGDAHVGVWQ